jgi:hypothetical protein
MRTTLLMLSWLMSYPSWGTVGFEAGQTLDPDVFCNFEKKSRSGF